MKVVAPGIKTDGWFVGKQANCWKCAALVTFDESDAGGAHQDTSYQGEGDLYLKWTCPECGANNSLSGPTSADVEALKRSRKGATVGR